MLVLAVKPGHDGSIAVIKDRQLMLSLESEKDSFSRHCALVPDTVLHIAEEIGELPDVVGLGG